LGFFPVFSKNHPANRGGLHELVSALTCSLETGSLADGFRRRRSILPEHVAYHIEQTNAIRWKLTNQRRFLLAIGS